jgi:hypothetical protein
VVCSLLASIRRARRAVGNGNGELLHAGGKHRSRESAASAPRRASNPRCTLLDVSSLRAGISSGAEGGLALAQPRQPQTPAPPGSCRRRCWHRSEKGVVRRSGAQARKDRPPDDADTVNPGRARHGG